MTLYELWSHYDFNWQAAMRGTGFSVNAYQRWLRAGCIPYNSQAKIQNATNGLLRASFDEDLISNDEFMQDPSATMHTMRHLERMAAMNLKKS